MPPLLPGLVGWVQQSEPPSFVPERDAKLDWTSRHQPAALRLFGSLSRLGMPRMSEAQAFAAVRALTGPGARGRIDRLRAPPDGKEETWSLITWLRTNDPACYWWRSQWGWRAPREFRGWRIFENDRHLPHLEPVEFAQFRLPEDIVLDIDVVLLQAWCQGVTGRFLDKLAETHEPVRGWREGLFEGLRKLHASPWFRLTMAVPFLPPVGITLGSAGVLGSVERMQQILHHPYTASLGELDAICKTATFEMAYRKAVVSRRKGEVTAADGGWYVEGHKHPLGVWFRRGAEFTAAARGRR